MIVSILFLLCSYLVGCIPTGRTIAKLHKVEIEKLGSGNVGATNIARNLGKKAGILTLAGDIAKGLIVIKLARYFQFASINDVTIVSLAAISVVMGHCFSLPGLKGGKGVATALGVLIGLSPMISVFSLLVFIAVFFKTRYVSAASITAVLSAPLAAMIMYPEQDFPLALGAVALLITFRHHENIQRLVEGRESKFNI